MNVSVEPTVEICWFRFFGKVTVLNMRGVRNETDYAANIHRRADAQ